MRRSGHALDWETKPLPFKVYPDLEPLRLPTGLPVPALETFAAISWAQWIARAGPTKLAKKPSPAVSCSVPSQYERALRTAA